MYGIFNYIWLICMVNVGKYTIRGWYGMGYDQGYNLPSSSRNRWWTSGTLKIGTCHLLYTYSFRGSHVAVLNQRWTHIDPNTWLFGHMHPQKKAVFSSNVHHQQDQNEKNEGQVLLLTGVFCCPFGQDHCKKMHSSPLLNDAWEKWNAHPFMSFLRVQ